MTTKLHQILAVERTIKKTVDRKITDYYQLLQKTPLLNGLSRTYQPIDDAGEQFPPENQIVQVRVADVLTNAQVEFERLWDTIATKDYANMSATADVVLPDGTVLIEGAPATFLLYLEKELDDVRTTIEKLPTLDQGEIWEYDAATAAYRTQPVQTHRTKKVPKVLVKAEATEKHPAQTEVYQEDVLVGYWSSQKFSGALPADTVREMLDRVNEAAEAVKVARSKANETDIQQQKIAAPLLDYMYKGSVRN